MAPISQRSIMQLSVQLINSAPPGSAARVQASAFRSWLEDQFGSGDNDSPNWKSVDSLHAQLEAGMSKLNEHLKPGSIQNDALEKAFFELKAPLVEPLVSIWIAKYGTVPKFDQGYLARTSSAARASVMATALTVHYSFDSLKDSHSKVALLGFLNKLEKLLYGENSPTRDQCERCRQGILHLFPKPQESMGHRARLIYFGEGPNVSGRLSHGRV